ncbi:MAG: MurR/RpiR family transcriptional regulator [Hyphomicrobiaceae bacterium]
MRDGTKSVAEELSDRLQDLTRAERQLADTIRENYPISGLGSITALAENAGVSTPTVVRMVQKLGFSGYTDFQAELRRELEEKISNPIAKRDKWVESASEKHILNRFTEAVISNIEQSLAAVQPETFDEVCRMLSDTDRRVFVVGGRITRTIADYFFLHLQVIRRKVIHVQAISNAWPHYLLDVHRGDVVVIFDVRRYENSILRLAEMVREKGATIVLFTDQWRSPVQKIADQCFSARISAPSAWDSSVATLLLVESLIAAIQEVNWDQTRSRMEDLEMMFDRTRVFRKFT